MSNNGRSSIIQERIHELVTNDKHHKNRRLFLDTWRKTVTLLMALFCHYDLWNVTVNIDRVNFTFCLCNENKIRKRKIVESF